VADRWRELPPGGLLLPPVGTRPRSRRNAQSSNLTTRAISTPKLIVTDSGLGGRLIGMSEERAKDPTALVGPLLENFAIGEVARQLTWAEEPVQLFHYRDRDQVEVDMVLEHADGTVIGIEVKAAETVRGEDFRGLRHLANRLGDRFRAGIVLYAGEQQLSFGDRLTALPMAALWTLDGSASIPLADSGWTSTEAFGCLRVPAEMASYRSPLRGTWSMRYGLQDSGSLARERSSRPTYASIGSPTA
jgi:hypothetical protein